ncbi:MAG TPA: hypothetical protein PLB52_02900 [Candidatus Moranbacteria bacterium]|nr:hypothetical protein [Candidatus Moranbacteria bacterium]
MANPFEQGANLNEEMQAEASFKKLYRNLSKLVHDDKFNGFTKKEFKEEFEKNAALKQRYEEFSKEKDELMKAINAIKGGGNGVGGWYKGRDLNSFVEKLEAINEIKADVDSFYLRFEEFLKEVNDYKAQSAKNKKNTGAGQNANQAGAGPTSTGGPGAGPTNPNANPTGAAGGPKTANQTADEEKKAWEEFHNEVNQENSSDDDEQPNWYEGYKQDGSEQQGSKTNTSAEAGADKTNEAKLDADPEAAKAKMEAEKARREEIEKLRQELADVRKEYLEVDYKKNTALSRIRKFFGKTKENEGKGFEQDAEVAEFRAYYDNKLFELQQKIIADAKERGASDKELADIFIEFRTEQKIILADEHNNVMAEQRFGTKAGKIGKWVEDKVKWYNELPIKTKLAVAGVFIGAGMLTAPAGFFGASLLAGSSVAGFIGGATTAKRIFSGLAAGVGISMRSEAKGQQKDKEIVEKDREEFSEYLKSLENMKEDDRKNELLKYEKYQLRQGISEEEQEEKIKNAMREENFKHAILEAKIESIAIKDEENSLNNFKNRKIKNDVKGAIAGIAIGSGALGSLLHGFNEHFNVTDHLHKFGSFLGWGQGESAANLHDQIKPGVAGAHGGVIDESRVPKGYGGTSNENLFSAENDGGHAGPAFPGTDINDIAEGKTDIVTPIPENVPTDVPGEIDHHEPVFDQNLTIEKGSSIEGTIIKQLKEMGVENPGAKAHRMFLEYMQENKDSIIDKVGLDEYEKMLKDGMVNVQPGTELHIVADTGKDGFSLREVHGNMSHIEPKVSHIDIPDENHSDVHTNLTAEEIGPEAGNGSAGVEGSDIQPSAGTVENGMETMVDQENSESALNNKEYQGREHVAGDESAIDKGVENAASHKMSIKDFNIKHGNVENYRGLSNFVRAEDADNAFRNKIIASENAKSLARAVFGYNIDTGQAAHQLRGEKIMNIMDARGREEFLQRLPSENSRRVFKEMLKAAPPKLSHDNMLKWFQYVAMGAGRAKNLETFDTTGI